MILVDTSVWIGHLRLANLALARLLVHGRVAMHLFVIDLHLLTAGALQGEARLWTGDTRLAALAEELGLGFFEKWVDYS